MSLFEQQLSITIQECEDAFAGNDEDDDFTRPAELELISWDTILTLAEQY